MTTRQQVKQWYLADRKRTCEALGITDAQYNTFRLLGNKLNLLYTRQCNGYHQEFLEKQDERREVLLTEKARAYAQRFNLNIYFQTDPRGATIYLDTKPIATNAYTNAHCIR